MLPLRLVAFVAVVVLLAALTRAQTPGARLSGTVLDPHSRPVVGALVTAERDGEVLTKSYTDASGLFVLTRLPRAELVIRARPNTDDLGAAYVDLADPRREPTTVRTLPTRRLAGSVKDASGAPVANAWVAFTPLARAPFGALSAATRADESGRYELDRVPVGTVAVRAWAPDHAGFAGSVAGDGDAMLDCVFDDGEPIVRRFEVADATPAATAGMRLEIAMFVGEARILAPPEFAHPTALAPGSWQVAGWASADAMHAWVLSDDVFVEPVEQRIPADTGDRRKVFYAASGDDATVRGVLESSDGLAVAGRRLAASGVIAKEEHATRSATTDADGRFTMLTPVPIARSFRIECLDDDAILVDESGKGIAGFGLGHRSKFSCKHSATAEHHLRLVPAFELRAEVHQPDGDAYPGAEVAVLLAPPQQVARVLAGNRFRTVLLGYAAVHGATDLGGALAIPKLDLGTNAQIMLQVTGPHGFAERTVDVGDGRLVDAGRLDCEPAATLQGRVLSSAGEPVAGAFVAVESLRGMVRTYQLAADREGRFTLAGLPPGPCNVTLVDDGANRRGAAAQQLTLEGGQIETVELQATAPGKAR
ncbi:MAG: carboxypeptidase regulatory-like domain-containing protein [Planctomycetes bacterium]|nr:carboxypeptidase regulatory-like domain-containing protein [Planctomycetota bacterium]